jgi:hypothetical protein
MRNGSAIANGARQYAVTITSAQWWQLEAVNGNTVAANGLATPPVRRWPGQMAPNTSGTSYDYVQGFLIQNTSTTDTLYLTTSEEGSGAAPTSRLVANATRISPGAEASLSNTDATKVYLRSGGGNIVAAVLAT